MDVGLAAEPIRPSSLSSLSSLRVLGQKSAIGNAAFIAPASASSVSVESVSLFLSQGPLGWECKGVLVCHSRAAAVPIPSVPFLGD